MGDPLQPNGERLHGLDHLRVVVPEWVLDPGVLASLLDDFPGIHPATPVPAHEIRARKRVFGEFGEPLSALGLIPRLWA